MKKLLLLVGLVVFLTPMVVSGEENDLSGFHCINQVGVDNQVGGNDYEWRNISKSCGTFESN